MVSSVSHCFLVFHEVNNTFIPKQKMNSLVNCYHRRSWSKCFQIGVLLLLLLLFQLNGIIGTTSKSSNLKRCTSVLGEKSALSTLNTTLQKTRISYVYSARIHQFNEERKFNNIFDISTYLFVIGLEYIHQVYHRIFPWCSIKCMLLRSNFISTKEKKKDQTSPP